MAPAKKETVAATPAVTKKVAPSHPAFKGKFLFTRFCFPFQF